VLRAVNNANRCLRTGVLTVRDAGCGHTGIFQIRSAIASGQISGPRLLIPGYPIAMTGGHGWDFAFEVDGPDAVRRAVRDMLRWGADCIKFMVTGGAGTQYEETDQVQMTPEELKAGAEEAKKKSKRTFAHCTNPQGALVCVEAGVDSIDHGTLLDKAALDVMKRSNSFYVPTLYVYSGIATRGKEVGLDEWMIKKAEGIIDSHKKAFQTAYKTGVNIATGTDLGSEKMERFGKIGDDLISEIELMVRYGMTPMDAIKAATYTSSRNLGIENSVGTIEKGKLADLVILDDDPLLDISNLRRVSQVMKEGKIVYKA